MNDLSSMLLLLLRKVPLILVLLTGLGIAVIRWKQHPRVSLFASIGITIYIIEIFVMAAVYYLLPGQMRNLNISLSPQVFTVIQIVEDFIYSGILILLVTAAFSGRAPKPVLKR